MSWKVPYINYPTHYRNMKDEILHVIDETFTQGDLIMRQQLYSFEENLASFVGTNFAVGVGNCTDGMHLSLLAAGIGPGDEVITVSHTMVATAAAIHHAGAIPVLVDIADDHNMDPSCIEAAITPRTKAIMPVQLNGRICPMNTIMALAEQYGLVVVEDSAQALGASFDGVKAGAFGLAACFSFYPAKLLGAFGDGGAVVTNSEEIADKVKLLRNHGRLPNGDVSGWSFNSRLDNIHAALLDLKLKRLVGWIDRRRSIARLYHNKLYDVPELLLPPPPLEEGPFYDVFQNYEIEAENRDGLREYLTQQGVETMISWGGKGVHQFPALGLTHHQLPRTDLLFERVLMLPMYVELTDPDVEFAADTVRSFYGK